MSLEEELLPADALPPEPPAGVILAVSFSGIATKAGNAGGGLAAAWTSSADARLVTVSCASLMSVGACNGTDMFSSERLCREVGTEPASSRRAAGL